MIPQVVVHIYGMRLTAPLNDIRALVAASIPGTARIGSVDALSVLLV
jgi:hypothetical protein